MVFVLLSPSKTLSSDHARPQLPGAMPHFQDRAHQLAKQLRDLGTAELMTLMSISDRLAQLNRDRFRAFAQTPKRGKCDLAILAFQGDTYKGLDAKTLTDTQIQSSHQQIGILSGLYGIVQPLDLIQPYRLEMGTPLIAAKHKNLYEFWGSAVTDQINTLVKQHKHKAVIGCASQEYLHVVQTDKLAVPFINCDFKEKKNGTFQTIGIHAKRARGLMARFIVGNKVKNPSGLLDFNGAGYRYNKTLSNDSNFVFTRTL